MGSGIRFHLCIVCRLSVFVIFYLRCKCVLRERPFCISAQSLQMCVLRVHKARQVILVSSVGSAS